MRRSGWAAAAGLGSFVLLLTACGGSSSSSAGATGSTPAAAQPSSAIGGFQRGDVLVIAQISKVGYVLAEANHQVLYTYQYDKKGGPPTCTGSCAATWLPATVANKPLASIVVTLPGKLGTVTTANGAKQITYNGYPLYLHKGALPFATTGDDMGGQWHVIKLAKSVINSG